MTTLVLENLAGLSDVVARGVHMHLTRLGRWIDSSVSALAARKVPEWQMRDVQSDIIRHRRPLHG